MIVDHEHFQQHEYLQGLIISGARQRDVQYMRLDTEPHDVGDLCLETKPSQLELVEIVTSESHQENILFEDPKFESLIQLLDDYQVDTLIVTHRQGIDPYDVRDAQELICAYFSVLQRYRTGLRDSTVGRPQYRLIKKSLTHWKPFTYMEKE